MIVPSLHRILIKADRLEDVDTTHKMARAAGIIMPETADKARAQAGVDRGTVVSIGPTAFKDFNATSPIEVGSYVAYARFAGKIITDPYTDEEFVLINDEDLCCVFHQD